MISFITTSIAYNSFIGSFVGIASLFLATLWTGRFTPSVFAAFPLILLFSFLAPALAGFGITKAGIIITLFYDLLLIFIYLVFFGGRLHRSTIFFLTHFFWNIWVFVSIAPWLMTML